jgi:alkanesulfonate monooxygenase SsuD/methylene tetrahydromethanopterin reductase-like flavin-dependent oxidoreductase (luciferase family)
VLRRLWSEPLVNFSGRFHRLDGVGINPLPDRTIPLWMGTRGSQAALARVARTADGWMPLLAPPLGDATLPEAVAQLRHACEASGRDPATMAVWGRTYLRSENDPALEPALSEALEVGCSQFSVGFARGHGLDHAAQLEAIIAHRARIDALLG